MAGGGLPPTLLAREVPRLKDGSEARPGPGSYGVVANGREIRRRLNRVGGSTVDLADRAGVARGTVSRALNGRPIQRAKLRAIAAALNEWPLIPGVDALINLDARNHGESSDG